MTRADDPYSSAPASSSSFSHSPSQSSLYPAGQHDNDADSFYSQSPGRPNMYHDPSAPVLARPATGGARASFETSGTYDAPSSPQRTGGGIAGSPFNDEDDSGSFMRPRKNAGGATPRGTSIFDSVYNASNSRCVRTSSCHPPLRSSLSPLRCPDLPVDRAVVLTCLVPFFRPPFRLRFLCSPFDCSLAPPQRPFINSSSSSSVNSPSRPLSVHYLPQKYPTPHKQGQWAHRRKTGGGRAAFAEVSSGCHPCRPQAAKD